MPRGSTYERELKKMLEEKGYFVIRSAGSFATDLIAIRIGEVKGFEIKSCGSNVFRLDSRSKEQIKELKELRKYGIEPCFAVRFKQKGVEKTKNWRFFKPESVGNSVCKGGVHIDQEKETIQNKC